MAWKNLKLSWGIYLPWTHKGIVDWFRLEILKALICQPTSELLPRLLAPSKKKLVLVLLTPSPNWLFRISETQIRGLWQVYFSFKSSVQTRPTRDSNDSIDYSPERFEALDPPKPTHGIQYKGIKILAYPNRKWRQMKIFKTIR